MREFFELVCEYPWTTFFLILGLCLILESLGVAIHGPEKTIVINKDTNNKKKDK